MSEETAMFGDVLKFWFETLDNAARNLGQTVEGVEIPMEYLAALALLALTPESPFYKRADGGRSHQSEDVQAAVDQHHGARQ